MWRVPGSRVCSRSSCSPIIELMPHAFPSAFNSSMKRMLGALAWACSKRSCTHAAPTPTNISTKPVPLKLKKGTVASPATALARRVLPVPGAPTSNTPACVRRCTLLLESPMCWATCRMLYVALSQKALKIRRLLAHNLMAVGSREGDCTRGRIQFLSVPDRHPIVSP